MKTWPSDPWENGVLDREHHERFVHNRQKYAADVGIPVNYLWCPNDVFDQKELGWVNGFRSNRASGIAGLAYFGAQFSPPIENRMFALAGKLTRNFIGAKVGYIDQIFASARTDGYPQEKCLFLPTFCDAKSDAAKGFSASGLLLQRFSAGQQTVLYAPNEARVKELHGQQVLDHIKQNYTIITGVGL